MTRTYLVECYWPGVSEAQVVETIMRSSEPGADDAVRHLDSVLIPADEIVLSVFEGPSAEAVLAATRRAGMLSERVVESVRVGARISPTDGEER
jgi:hypothetical protein